VPAPEINSGETAQRYRREHQERTGHGRRAPAVVAVGLSPERAQHLLPERSSDVRVDLRFDERYVERKTMETVTLSTKYQLVLPRRAREHIRARPGMRFTVVDKGGVVFLIPERPMRDYRGVARGATRRGLREKKDRL